MDIKTIAVRFGPGKAHRHIGADSTLRKGLEGDVKIDDENTFVVAVNAKKDAMTDEQKATLAFCMKELKRAFPDAKVTGLEAPKSSAPSAPEQPPASEGKKDETT